jgi:hypothetical protein
MMTTVVLAWLSRAWGVIVAAAKWLWSHPVALAGAVGTVVGAVLMVRSKKNQIDRLSDALEVQRIRANVAGNEAKAEALTAQADHSAQEVAAIRTDIAASKRRAAELAHATNLEGKTDAEVAKLFSDAGL